MNTFFLSLHSGVSSVVVAVLVLMRLLIQVIHGLRHQECDGSLLLFDLEGLVVAEIH